MIPPEAPPSPSKSDRGGIEGYYRWHARIYDATRWSFLFGREAVLDRVAVGGPAPTRILEIGCGTGRNVVSLARRFPQAEITGVDLSEAMLAVAARKAAPKPVAVEAPKARVKLTYKDQRDYDLLPRRIEELESAIARDEEALMDGSLYSGDPKRFAALTAAIVAARAEKDAAEERWLELAEMVEALG